MGANNVMIKLLLEIRKKRENMKIKEIFT